MSKIRKEKKRNTREKILVAAYELFEKQGYDNTSYSEIAKLAGVGYGTIYSHFKSKESLLLEHYLELMAKQLVRLQTMADIDRSNPLKHGLKLIDIMWQENATMPLRKLEVFFSYRWVSSREDYERVVTAMNNIAKLVGSLFKKAQEKGQIDASVNLEIALSLINVSYLRALQIARFGKEESKRAKKELDQHIAYLLKLES